VLSHAEQLTRASQPKVLLGKCEAVMTGDDRVHPRLAISALGIGEQEDLPGVLAPADPASELMELSQPETLGILDDHHGGVGNVDADLDDRSAHQNVEPPSRNRRITPSPLGRLHPAGQHTDPEIG
jgi:hypothetical protein